MTVEEDATRALGDVFTEGGRFVVSVGIQPPNDSPTSFHEDADGDNRRFDTREIELPVEGASGTSRTPRATTAL